MKILLDLSPLGMWSQVLICMLLEGVLLEELEAPWRLEELEVFVSAWTLVALAHLWEGMLLEGLEVVGATMLEADGRDFE